MRDDKTACFYDLDPDVPDDLPFYVDALPGPRARVLELGCGTGRVLVPLAEHCGFIMGIDASPAMLEICREKLRASRISTNGVRLELAEIERFEAGRRFDLIIAPFRVIQSLETDAQLAGLFECLHAHLDPGGSCVLDVFRPYWPPDELCDAWLADPEVHCWETTHQGRRVLCLERRRRVDPVNRVLYPEFVYRVLDGERLVDETVFPFRMRCFYPDEFVALARAHGFRVVERWGGYRGEPYGSGPELILRIVPDRD